MDVCLQMSPKMQKMVPWLRTRQKGFYKPKTISCSAKNLAIQKVDTNFYEVLSLDSENVGFDEIKKAYRTMALQYHPDVCPLSTKEESTMRFIELRKAYETLSDPSSRRMYDYELGLVDSSLGCCSVKERGSTFPKEVWERQLCGLRERSSDRMERKRA
ncbi:hypothetical protein CsSME_00006359 [Camellia sinensis var. sinensis]